MSKRLILMRHAKSSWDDPRQSDHERPLNGRGRVSAKALGEWLNTKKYLPDQALVSSAARTRETFARLGIACDAAFLKGLYHAGEDRMLDALQRAKGNCVLMLGHNPGIGEFAHALLAEQHPHPRFYDYPTCATLVADFPIGEWSELRFGMGQAVDFVIPRELTG